MQVDFDELEWAFDFVSTMPRFTNSARLSRATGHIYYVSDYVDTEEVPDDVDDPEKYISIPHKNDLDLGIVLVRRFVSQYIPDQAERVDGFFRSSGAYSRYKDLLESMDVLEAWYNFEMAETKAALKAWCADNEIEVME